MGVEGVEGVEGGIGHDFDGAVACRREEGEVWGVWGGGEVVGEGGSVCLDGLGAWFEGGVVWGVFC